VVASVRSDFLKQTRLPPGISFSAGRTGPPEKRSLSKTFMKNLLKPAAALLAVASLTLSARAESSPGFVELGKFAPPGKGAELVEVQLRSNLIGLAAQLVEKQEPEAARLLRSVELVQVKVVGLTKDNREELGKQIAKLQSELDSQNWERNVTVQGKKGEDVAVYTKTRGGEALSGVVITVKDKEHAVFVNLVGDIKPEQVAKLGEKLNIEPLKKAGEAVKKEP
jgi:hypothetical protein